MPQPICIAIFTLLDSQLMNDRREKVGFSKYCKVELFGNPNEE